MASFRCVFIHCYLDDVYPKVAAVSEDRYSWEPAVLNAFTAAPETVAAKIEGAKQAIAGRLKDQNPPDPSETAALMYALEALETLSALRLLIDSASTGPTSEDPS